MDGCQLVGIRFAGDKRNFPSFILESSLGAYIWRLMYPLREEIPVVTCTPSSTFDPYQLNLY